MDGARARRILVYVSVLLIAGTCARRAWWAESAGRAPLPAASEPGPRRAGPPLPSPGRPEPAPEPVAGEPPPTAAGPSDPLAALAPRVDAHLDELEVGPNEPLDPTRFGPLIGEQRRLVDAHRALSASDDLRVAADAARAEAELHDAFGAWLDEVARRIPHDPELVGQLQSLADGRYAEAEQGWELADELEAAEPP
jgi:hypothetical protein